MKETFLNMRMLLGIFELKIRKTSSRIIHSQLFKIFIFGSLNEYVDLPSGIYGSVHMINGRKMPWLG